MICRCVCFAYNRNVMIGSIQRRAHQIGHAGIHADVIAVGMLEMPHSADEITVRSCDATAAFQINLQLGMPLGNQTLFVGFSDAFTYNFKVDALLFRTIGNADAAAEIDEFKGDTKGGLKLGDKVEVAYEKIEDKVQATYYKVEGAVVDAYQKVEDTVVGAYKTVETNVVEAYEKIEDKAEVLLDKLEDKAEDWKEKAEDLKDQLEDKVEELKDKLEDKFKKEE